MPRVCSRFYGGILDGAEFHTTVRIEALSVMTKQGTEQFYLCEGERRQAATVIRRMEHCDLSGQPNPTAIEEPEP